ncbi:hypothetical protein [Legionella sp. 29fVS95]|uniref:hypothetical protein n=1 Tax=Legionella sp. 29fVS95 TaxID=3402813 RepID=UPI003AF7FF07
MREKQESKLALAERKIIIAGRMGENDARRGKPRKDFSMTNKSQEYVSSYNVGYDKIALQRIQTKKRQIPSSSLPVNLKRTKVDAVSVSTRATESGRAQGDEEEEVRHNLPSSSNRTGDLGQSIRNMPSHQRITIGARTITVDAFLKRHYIFQDTKEKVSRRALYHAVLFEDGTITVQGRLIKWNTRIKSADISQLIKIGEESPITRGGFLKRTYVFKDTGEVVGKKAKKAAKIHKDGTVTVNGKLIERRKKSSIRDGSIGEEVTEETQGDVRNDGSEKEIGIKEENFSFSSGDYEVPAGLKFDELWKMLIPDYIDQGGNPGTQGNDNKENAALSSALSDVAGSPGFEEFKKQFMADTPRVNPECRGQSLGANPFERGEAGAEGLSELSPQARQSYSPQFFSGRGKSERVATPRQVSETSMRDEGGKEPNRDRAGPHWQPAYFTQQFVKEEKEDDVNKCILC